MIFQPVTGRKHSPATGFLLFRGLTIPEHLCKFRKK